MTKMYLLLLLFMSLGWRECWTKDIVRNDKDCGVPSKHQNLPQCDWHYIAYFPRIFQSGSVENVTFSTHGFPNVVDFHVEILALKGKPSRKVITKVTKQAKPGELTSVAVRIPHNAPGTVKVRVYGSGKTNGGDIWRFTNTSSDTIHVKKLGLKIIIQTDRPIYKPGQLIRSRVIVIDSNLRPYNGKLESVTIENPSGSIMRIWRNTDLDDGFASFELKTSVKPVLGKWKIKVAALTYEKVLTITVDKYVLPKFQVTLTPPSFLTIMMKTINVKVCAKYSYGKPVLGNMNATICIKRRYTYWGHRGNKNIEPTCLTVSKKIDGCANINIDFENVLKVDYLPTGAYVLFNATVKERATGVSMSSRKISMTVNDKEVELSIESVNVFKPGFPLSVKLLVKYPDGKPFVDQLRILLVVTCRGVSKDLLREWRNISKGVEEVDLPVIPFSAKNVNIRIKYTRKRLHTNKKNRMRKSSAYKIISPWYSPSHSYLNVHKPQDSVKIGSKLSITVGYTSVDAIPVNRNITYSMMCAGNLVTSGTISRTFIPAVSSMATTTTTPTPTTTTTTTTPSTNTNSTIFDGYINKTILPPPLIHFRPYHHWWQSTATRPPLPLQFSTAQFTFSVDIVRAMLPSCRMVVYYIRNEEVIADETLINVENEFENPITMQFDRSEVTPGSNVKLTVRGAPNSRIAVAAVDKSIHFLATGNDIKRKHLMDIREELTIAPGYVRSGYGRCPWYRRKRRSIWGGYGSNDFVDSEKAFANVGVVLLSSLHTDVRPCGRRPMIANMIVDDSDSGISPKVHRKKNVSKKTRARTDFPETWLWTDKKLSENGVEVFDLKVPDTITTWYASGFGISQSAGLGVATPTELRAFQPFFISLTLPYAVIRDEEVTIPAAIFSYLEKACMTIRVSLAFSKDYKMVAGPDAKTCLCTGRTATVLFRIIPKKLGYINIRIRAETLTDNVCAANRPFADHVSVTDILERKLLVEPEGIKEEYTRSTFFCPNKLSGKEFKTELELKLPDNLVVGSVFAKVVAMGDIMGSSLSNVDELLAMPYGCGEQNMLKFAPNIFIMNYLNNTGQVNVEIETKALDYMRTGYQRELTYKHRDGAYSAFGNRDEEGSTWLTAFVLKSYAQARPWIDVDPKEISMTSDWLIKSQDRKGCFPKIGHLHHKAMKGGVQSDSTLTAYVLISLLEADWNPNSTPIRRATKCVSFRRNTDTYSLAIMAYLYAKLKYNGDYVQAMKLLNKKAIIEDGLMHWEEKKAAQPNNYYHKSRSTDIEQTAYVLLAKLEHGGKKGIKSAVPIVRWLSKQRNSLGGWSSTQDTVLAMQALAAFAELSFKAGSDMEVAISADNFDHTFNINAGNKMVLQRVENVPVPSTLEVVGKGDGCALIQANVKFNVMKVKVEPTFVVTYGIKSIRQKLNQRKSCRSQHLKICARWIGDDDESNMAIVDVQMISGFEADGDSFEKILASTKHLKDIEVKEKSVVFYFRKIGRKFQCVRFRVDQKTNVRKTKPAPIKVYDYYDTGKSSTIMYSFTDEHCSGKMLTSA